MPPHRIRDIAALSGLSQATVDRVLHQRGTTSPASAQAVRAAVSELDRQQARTRSGTQRLSIEAIVADDASRAQVVRDRLHEVRPRLRPRVVHTFVRTVPPDRPDQAASALARVQSRRPQGVLIDLADDPAVVEQAEALLRAGIPVVTTNRPFPGNASLGHSGLDNRAAGATAAYLMSRSQPAGTRFAVVHGEIMTSVEVERVDAFTAIIGQLHPGSCVTSFPLKDASSIDLQEHGGVYVADEGAAGATSVPLLRERLGRSATVVGHRDADLLPQIATQVFDFTLDMDWEAVISEGCSAILRYHRRGLGQVVVSSTPPSVLTPYNLGT